MKISPESYVIVMGLAKSGEAAARLLHRYGARVTVNEGKPLPTNDEVVTSLEALGIRVVSGHHPIELLDAQPDFIVKNPGIPYRVPFLVEAEQRGIPIYTEIELASWFTESPIYAITGSNGKTTTTSLTGAILREAGQNPAVAGNIGTVLSGVVSDIAPARPIVLEVSSFQLLGTETFHPRIAVLLNFYQAHLDYHGSFEAYMDAKWKLFQNMGHGDTAVLNYNQEAVRSGAARLTCSVRWFATEGDVPEGVFVKDGVITERSHGEDIALFPVSDVVLRGKHNLENVLASVLVARTAGVSVDPILRAVSSFQGVEHRSELVRTVDGVTYINDSKATNSEAASQALRAFPEHVVWIAGGLDRGDDFARLVGDLEHRVDAAVLLGESAEALAKACAKAGVPKIQRVDSLEEAVQVAQSCAQAGSTVLLSPACASWDMFKSFEERGSMFKSLVHRL